MASDESVQVALRIRPQSAGERIDLCHVCTSVTPDEPQVVLGKDKAFTYDYVFDTSSEQADIFSKIAEPLIEGCFDGYNATIVAYGQTGSGKTYTMGTSFDVGVKTSDIGIIPRAATHLFDGITRRRNAAEESGRPVPEFKVMAQFLELYNEDIVDLLDIENKGRKNIKIHEDHNGNIYLTGVVSRPVNSAEDCMSILEEGAVSRTTAATNMNATSSRSHAIFTLLVKHHRFAQSSSSKDGDEEAASGVDEFETLNAKFNFVDLAGSERLKRTGATGDRAKEGISINQGLLSLGNVISALGDKAKRGTHVPYRDSKLTRLLQDSLGGNSRTLMIACVSPSDRDFMETLNTLKYANRARNIKNRVVVNQDKASQQIAKLRQEIQALELELLEFKQGKRMADEGGEHMTDVYHELNMLKTDNENLRMRIKAMQKNIDSQTIQITELKVTSALAHVTGDNEGTDVQEMFKKYVKEIEELRNQLFESEAMSSVAVRRADTVSRLAMSPTSAPTDGDTFSILEAAKQDLQKEKKLYRKWSKIRGSRKESENDDNAIVEESDLVNGEIAAESSSSVGAGDANAVIDDSTDQSDDVGGDKEVEEEAEEEGNEELDYESNTDSDEDVNSSIKDEEELQDNINNLNTDITIKQKLIDELEHSQQRLTALKHQYEQKLALLHNKIKETEEERDKVLKSIGSVDSLAREKSDEVRKRYEKKLQAMQKELQKLQSSKREHQHLLKTKEQNEQQLKLMRTELTDMKKAKVRLMRQMRDEVARSKAQESKMSRQLEQMIKEGRKKEVEMKRMKDDQKQRDLVLKRKQEELNAMRKQIKPISGQVGVAKNPRRANNLQLAFQESAHVSSTFVVDPGQMAEEDLLRSSAAVKELPAPRAPLTPNIVSKELPAVPKAPSTPTSNRMSASSMSSGRSPAVSKRAKTKWEILERKITELTIRMKTVAQIENDMDRWLQDRNRITKQLESTIKRRDDAIAAKQDETLVKELCNNIEGLEANLEYIQDNITESQGVIMDMEEEGEGINPNEIVSACTLTESKYLLEHFYAKAIEMGQELANKDAAYKEIQIKLEALEQHCEVQQQLLQHACLAESGVTLEDIEAIGSQAAPVERKARRKTALPEELLHPKNNRASRSVPIAEVDMESEPPSHGDDTESKNEESVGKKVEIAKLDDKTLRKLLALDRTLREKAVDDQTFKVPDAPGGASLPTSRSLADSKTSFTGSTGSLNALPTASSAFQRNTRATSSARPFAKSASSSSLLRSSTRTSLKRPTEATSKRPSDPPSNKSSPALERKGYVDLEKFPTQNVSDGADSQDVFTRLTSNLPQEADPDVGQILPSKSPFKPESLICMYTATGHTNAVLSLDVFDNYMITGSKDRTAKVWDLSSGDEILSFGAHKRDVVAVKFNPVNKNLVFTVYQSVVKLWDIRQGPTSPVKTLSSSLLPVGDTAVTSLGLNKEGTVLYSAAGNSVKMIDLKTYSSLGKLTGHSGTVSCLLIAETQHHNDVVVTGSKDHSIRIFEVIDDPTASHMPRTNLEPPHYDGVQSLALKDTVLFSGSKDNSIKKWNFANHNLQQHLVSAHKDWVMAMEFLPQHDVLISGCRGGTLKLWYSGNGKCLGELPAHGKSINAVCCNSTNVFSASSDRLVRIWKPSQSLDDQIREHLVDS